MADGSYHWLDALTDGRMMRNWLSLIAHFAFSWFYLTFLMAGYALSIAMIPILVGIPLLLLMLAITCNLAALDRQIFATLLELDTSTIETNPVSSSGNLVERLKRYLGSMTTWRSLVYLGMKIPLGLMSLFIASIAVFPVLFEVLVLAPLTIDMHLIGVRLLRWTAVTIYKLNVMVLPTRKSKRTRRTDNDIAERRHNFGYYVGDDGELNTYAESQTRSSASSRL